MADEKSIMSYETVELDDENSAVVILDQTKLPNEVEILHLKTQQEIWDAIYLLQVRGAPAIGVAAGFGIYLAAKEINTDSRTEFDAAFHKAKEFLNSSRPTAVNLSWALNRMEQVLIDHPEKTVAEIRAMLKEECLEIKAEDVWMCRSIGEYGLTLIKDGDGILTHCNAGQLATSKYGTALAPIHLGRERGMNFKVFCDETRPLLQGARLSSFELYADGVDTTVICDNMASQVMKNGWVNAVFVGCDRVAANGDACNHADYCPFAGILGCFECSCIIASEIETIDFLCIDDGHDAQWQAAKDGGQHSQCHVVARLLRSCLGCRLLRSSISRLGCWLRNWLRSRLGCWWRCRLRNSWR